MSVLAGLPEMSIGAGQLLWNDIRLILAIGTGLVVAAFLSTATTIKARIGSVASGLFFAIFLTQPLIKWAGLEFGDWQYAVAGLLAMTGDRLARRIMLFVDEAQPWNGGRR